MQSVLSLPLRLSDTLLSPFKESNNVFISPYWEKIAIIFFPDFSASPSSVLLLTRPWKLVSSPSSACKLLLTASPSVHPPAQACVGTTVAADSGRCCGALGPPAAARARAGLPDGTDGEQATKHSAGCVGRQRDTLEDAELKYWVVGGCCSEGIRTATLGKAKEMLNLRGGSMSLSPWVEDEPLQGQGRSLTSPAAWGAGGERVC